MMTASQFHDLLLKAPDALSAYVHEFYASLRHPRKHMESILGKRESSQFILAGVFLFANISLSLALPYIPGIFTGHALEAMKGVGEEIPKFCIGNGLFLVLLGVFSFGGEIPLRSRLELVSVASVVYPLWVIFSLPFDYMLGNQIPHFIMSIMYGQILSLEALKAAAKPLLQFGVPSLWIHLGFLAWWVYLVFGGLRIIDRAADSIDCALRLGYSLTTYIAIKAGIIVMLSLMGYISIVMNYYHYTQLKESLESSPTDYAAIMMTSSGLANALFMPAYGKYIGSVCQAFAQAEMYFPSDKELDGIKTLLSKGRWREAHLSLKLFIEKKLLDRKDPKRIVYSLVTGPLETAETAYHSPMYTEAETQQVMVLVSPSDAWLEFFP